MDSTLRGNGVNQEEQVVLLIKGSISEMSKESQELIYSCADKIRTLILECGDEGRLACALVGAELAAMVD